MTYGHVTSIKDNVIRDTQLEFLKLSQAVCQIVSPIVTMIYIRGEFYQSCQDMCVVWVKFTQYGFVYVKPMVVRAAYVGISAITLGAIS